MPVPTTLYRGAVVQPSDRPQAQALLVVDDRIGWVGSDADAARHEDAADEVVDLDGALVTPAFVDAHAHTTETGLALTGVDLTTATGVTDVLARVEDGAKRGSGPILGHGWDDRGWPERRPPTRHELDRAGGGRPVYLARVDVHSAVVSSALAERHGLADLPGWSDDGRVERDAHHAARALTRDQLGPADRRRLQGVALEAAAQAGIGCLHEMSAPHIAPPADLRELLTLAGATHRAARWPGVPDVVGYRGELVGNDADVRRVLGELDLAAAHELSGLAGDLCVDGSVGSRTAAMRTPYADAASCGHTYLSAEQVRDHVVACTRAGLRGGFHVIGDAAVQVVSTGLRAAADVVGAPAMRAARHRLEHVELADAGAIATLAELGVTASVQPAFDAAWGGPSNMYAERLGAERALAMNPLGDLALAGVPLAFGSDSPVTPFDPWAGVSAAVWHHNPLQRMGVDAAFAAHTGGCRLVPGAPATYAVWTGAPGLPELAATGSRPRCARTVVRGRIAFDALR